MPENRLPIVGRLAVCFPVLPHIPARLWVRPGGPRFHEPGMLVRGMIQNQIRYHPYIALPGFGHQTVEVGHGSVLWIDGLIVGDVVAEIDLWGWIERCDPYGIDSQAL